MLPGIVFGRGVTTKYPVTFIHPVGGYGFGVHAGEFVAANAEPGVKVLMLRIVPGIDVLETRASAAKRIFKEKELEVIGEEFTEGDNAKTKSIVEDYLAKGAFGTESGAYDLDAHRCADLDQTSSVGQAAGLGIAPEDRNPVGVLVGRENVLAGRRKGEVTRCRPAAGNVPFVS